MSKTGQKIKNIYDLTPMQEGMLFHAIHDPESTAYIEISDITLSGNINIPLLEETFSYLVNRHDVLKSIFLHAKVAKPRQVVFLERKAPVLLEDYSSYSDANERADAFLKKEKAKKFDLSKDLLIRLNVLVLDPKTVRIIWSFHHIIMDGWCMGIILSEFFSIYTAKNKGIPFALPEAVPFSHYLKWLGEQDKQEAGLFWKNYLADTENITPVKKADETISKTYHSADVEFVLSEQSTAKLSELASSNQISLNTFFQTVWSLLLQKLNGTQKAVFGTVVSGRPPEINQVDSIIGLFINTIPVVSDFSETGTFKQALLDMQESFNETKKHDYFPLPEILSYTPFKSKLFDHLLVFENYPFDSDSVNQSEQTGFGIEQMQTHEESSFKLNVLIIPGTKQIEIRFSYNKSAFSDPEIHQLKDRLLLLIGQSIANPEIRLEDLSILLADEKKRLLYEFNPLKQDFPKHKNIYRLFAEKAAENFERTAISEGEKQITYSELSQKVDELALSLQENQIRKGDFVAVMLNRSPELILSLLAILKCGAVYLPIDTAYPIERTKFMLTDSGAKMLISKKQFITDAEITVPILDLSTPLRKTGQAFIETDITSNDPAYLIYTSGSTGIPKGVLVPHSAFINTISSLVPDYGFSKEDVFTLFASPAFDASIIEIFMALVSGGKLVVLSKEIIADTSTFTETLQKNAVSILHIPPSYLSLLPDELNSVRMIITAGEAARPKDVMRFAERYTYINAYGPTESAVCTSFYRIDKNRIPRERIPIGSPIRNVRYYVLDEKQSLVPAGVSGELYIAGDGLALGYHNRSELNAEKFLPDPFFPGERMYRSGDSVKWLPDGNIEYIGRVDFQVKIRGFRIEMGEIESVLLKNELIGEAVILDKTDPQGEKFLVAYLKTDSDELNIQEIREMLLKELPEYMVPSYFVKLDQIPLTSNGKIDRKNFPEPDGTFKSGTEYLAPRDENEEKILEIWKEILNLDQADSRPIGINDNFFELGGHSLKITMLSSRIHKVFDVSLSVSQLFDNPTIAKTSALLDSVEKTTFKAIKALEKRPSYPLSAAQKRMYLLNRFDPQGTAYNMPQNLIIEGELDQSRIKNTFSQLLLRHDALRTSFVLDGDEPIQKISDDLDLEIEFCSAKTEDLEEINRQFIRPFDLSSAPLIRLKVVSTAPEKHILLIDIHHIIADGVSMEILSKEFLDLYEGKKLRHSKLRYTDFAVWQNELFQSKVFEEKENFWLKQFEGEIPVLNLQTDFQRPAVQAFDGNTFTFSIGKAQSSQLRELAQKTGTTLFMLFLAQYKVLLSRYSTQEDLIVGTPVAGRSHDDLQQLIGMFVNTLALRSSPADHKSFLEFLTEVRQVSLSAFEQQDYPFELLVEKLELQRDLSRNPLFDTMFVLQQANEHHEASALEISALHQENKTVKFDLEFTVFELRDQFEISISYSIRLFKPERIELMSRHFSNLLKSILENPEQKLGNLKISDEQEIQQLVYGFNNTGTSYDPAQSIIDLFEQQVDLNPQKIAIESGKESLSYQELNERVNKLAFLLRQNGAKPDQVIAIMMERSVELLIGILGILKSGAGYLPIDPAYPSDRVQYILNDSETAVILTDKDLNPGISFDGKLMFFPDLDLFEPAFPEKVNSSENLAYLIYTSGSTGLPKGVMLEHRNVVAFCSNFQPVFGIGSEDSILGLTTITFDISVLELICSLLKGVKLVLASDELISESKKLIDFIADKHVSVLQITPSRLQILLEISGNELFRGIKTLLVGGEALPPVLHHQLRQLKNLKAFNVYGPTEATIWSSAEFISDEQLTIGRPLCNEQIYILSRQNQIQPPGIPGEICIGGNGLAREYRNQKKLTQEKFIGHPFIEGQQVYKTGDVGKYLPDGRIVYLGRTDEQVKIRGYRIELGEITQQLTKHENIRESVVIDREDSDGMRFLCAYYVSPEELDPRLLKNFLGESLPDYMIPSNFVHLERIPLTPNGKIDRKALPSIDFVSCEYTEAENETQQKLVEIWEKVLNIGAESKTVGIDSNFFDLGGHSLKAMNMSAQIHKTLDVSLSLVEIFKHPTIRELAFLLEKSAKSAYESLMPVSEAEFYELSSSQKRMYLLYELNPDGTAYNMPLVLRFSGTLDQKRLNTAIKGLIDRHESLRTEFVLTGEKVLQRIHKKPGFQIEYLNTEESDPEQLISNFVRPFKLDQAPLLRLALVRTGNEEQFLLFDIHHIVSDGISMQVLIRDFMLLYHEQPLETQQIQYKDYAHWQNGLLKSDKLKKQADFWFDQFSGELPVLNLPTDFPRPAIKQFGGANYGIELNSELSEKLTDLARKNDATLYMVLLACYQLLLHKYSSQEDLIVASPVAGRPHADLENTCGIFINTLAIRAFPKAEKTVQEFLTEIRQTTLNAFENQDYHFDELVGKLNLERDLSRNPLFDTLFVLQNMDGATFKPDGSEWEIYESSEVSSKFDLSLQASENEDGISLSFNYCTHLFKAETIGRMSHHFVRLIELVTENPQLQIGELSLLGETEKRQLLEGFNQTEAVYPDSQTITGLFEEQVSRYPNKTALVFENTSYTYRELNELSNQFASYLREKYRIQPDELVAIQQETSEWLIISILGILKAGGAYVPIDPAYPQERIDFMLHDSKAKTVIDRQKINSFLEVKHTYPTENPVHINKSSDLAYVIYTSGSTGNPKGVLIEHRNLINYNFWFCNEFSIGEKECTLLLSNIAFDGVKTSVFGALLSGSELHVVKNELLRSPLELANYISENGITFIKITPPLLNVILSDDESFDVFISSADLRLMLVGGEKIKLADIQKIKSNAPRIQLINHYGPTESTIGCITYPIPNSFDSSIPIGKPISNTQIYIVDRNEKLLPIGVVGEIYISGAGVARGYLNREELSREKFIPNAFSAGKRIYKSGDLGRWLPDGNIEFFGRRDSQVKIRGYRIELGEIENKILGLAHISEALILDKTDQNGTVYLCAYLVSSRDSNPVNEFRDELATLLPEYMIPSRFVFMDKLPVTPNGKIDRKALPEADGKANSSSHYLPPANPVQEKLVQIWQDVLKTETIGIRDDFFALGGDSIKAIQVLARLRQFQLSFELRDLFRYSNIELLSLQVNATTRKIDQSEVKGEVLPSPIQHYFFREIKNRKHFNQALMLFSEAGFDEKILQNCFLQLLRHHDALRIKLQNGKLINRTSDEIHFELRVSDCPEEHTEDFILAESNNMQTSLDLENGNLVACTLFKTGHGDHLLIVIHHLVVDGVSWRIILEDLKLLYEQFSKGKRAQLQPKTDSYQYWTSQLNTYSGSRTLADEIPFWKKIVKTELGELPKNKVSGRKKQPATSVSISLSEEESANLLKGIHQAYNTEINDILLCALALAVCEWTGDTKVLIELEGHGREEIMPDLDVSRTVGWFTAVYPVLLVLENNGLSRQIREIKESLRKIPNKGIGYGILKYLSPEMEFDFKFKQEPEIKFNYLGHFEHIPEKSDFAFSPFSSGEAFAEENKASSLVLNALISSNQFSLDVNFDPGLYDPDEINRFAASYQKHLQEIIVHCHGIKETCRTPGDFTYKKLSLNALELLQNQVQTEIEDIYPLSPMQEGMLFHSVMNDNPGAYFEQTSLSLSGEVDLKSLEQSLNQTIRRHEILRSSFRHEGFDKALQVVFSKRVAKVQFIDLTDNKAEISDKNKLKQFIEQFKLDEKTKGFDLAEDVLIRLTLFKTGNQEYQLIWNHHHILMDAWCSAIVIKDFLQFYQNSRSGKSTDLPQTHSFAGYFKWLEKQDYEKAAAYWKKYLLDYEQQANLPQIKTNTSEAKFVQAEKLFEIGTKETAVLQELALRYKTTVNSLIQTFWGILLQRYNNVSDVVFGSVVSGRPPEVQGIEQMVGLFINTIPVRVKSEENIRFSDLIQNVQQTALESAAYDFYPLAEIQANSALKNELVQNILVFENYPLEDELMNSESDSIGFEITDLEAREQSNYDLMLIVVPGEKIRFKLDYNASRYEHQTIEKAVSHFSNLIRQVVEQPEIELKQLKLISEEEELEILTKFNATKHPFEDRLTLQDLFEKQVLQNPDKTALIFEGKTLSYQELNEKSNQLAHLLREKGIKGDELVPLMTDRSMEMVIGILAILKSGGAYLPLDPEIPASRLEYILKDSKAKVILSERKPGPNNFSIAWIDLKDSGNYQGQTTNPDKITTERNLAYVIYTSGSTGIPKGVLLEHKGVINRIQWMHEHLSFSTDEIVLQKTNYTFDVSVWEFFNSLCYGMTLVLCKKETISDPSLLIDLIEKEQITRIHFVPSMFRVFLNGLSESQCKRLKSLKSVFASGEALQAEEVQKHYRLFEIPLYNLYGPTEASVEVSCYETKANDTLIPIGKPIRNTQLLILDQQLNLVPVGVPGELHLAGAGLARAYLNQHELTAEKFILNPFEPSERLYKTGDLASYLPDGNVLYLGRIDQQVKIRGFRIELGEIESQLLKIKGISQAVVIAKTMKSSGSDELYLCAYLVSENQMDETTVKIHLSAHLPEYMLPAFYVQLDHIPLNSSGKLNRNALPEPDQRQSSGTDYEEPKTEMEHALVPIWQEVLAYDKPIGRKDNFFELGGHSLKAMSLSAEIEKVLGKKAALKTLFALTNIEQQAVYLESLTNQAYEKIVPLPEQEFYDVSPAQKRLWVLDQIHGGSVEYNMAFHEEHETEINPGFLHQAFLLLIQKHEVLRTNFIQIDGEPRQKIHAESDFKLESIDLSGKKDPEQEVKSIYERESNYAFDLEKDILLRATLIHEHAGKNHLIVVMHHIISDGWSLDLFKNELSESYQLLKNGEKVRIDRTEIQYKDYAHWQNRLSVSGEFSAHRNYWHELLQGELPVTEIPADLNPEKTLQFSGNRYTFYLEEELYLKLLDYSGKNGVSVFMFLLAAFKITLYKITQSTDLIVGTPVAGRQRSELKKLIGFFLNTIILRNKVDEHEQFNHFLNRLKDNTIRALEHQDYPFEQLVDELKIPRDINRFPIATVFFNMLNLGEKSRFTEKSHSRHDFNLHKMKFDLNFYALEYENALQFSLDYKNELYSPESIEVYAEKFKQVIQQVLEHDQLRISEISTSTFKLPESLQLKASWHSPEETLTSVFSQVVKANPDQTAVRYFKEELTYAELDQRSNALANHLYSEIGTGNTIGICTVQNQYLAIAILAVLKSGNCYLALDPEYPAERNAFICEEQKLNYMLLESKTLEDPPGAGSGIRFLNLGDFGSDERLNFVHQTKPEDLAYILYTSGSTGRPKGVKQTHGAICHFIASYSEALKLGTKTVMSGFSSVSFDSFNNDFYGALLNGGTYCPVSLKNDLSLYELRDWMLENKLNFFHAVPSFFRIFAQHLIENKQKLDFCKQIKMTGEATKRTDFKLYKQISSGDSEFIVSYGSTESTLNAIEIYTPDSSIPKNTLSPGLPVSATEIGIIDQNNRLLDCLEHGEIVISSPFVTPGYFNHPKLNEEAFIEIDGKRHYKSGDSGRITANGKLEISGRADDQVKIRGIRVELSEIEQAILTYPAIREACVTVHENEQLCAYYLSDQEIDKVELRNFLREKLAEYLIPAYYIQPAVFPLTPNGKTDKKNFPVPTSDDLAISGEFLEARTEKEKLILSLWNEVLNKSESDQHQIGIRDNFFELGGHSLKASAFVSRLAKYHNIHIALGEVFKHPTIEALAKIIEGKTDALYSMLETAPKQEFYPLSPAQQRIYVLNQFDPDALNYNLPMVFQLKGKLDLNYLETLFNLMVARHESLRTSFIEGEHGVYQQVQEKIEFRLEQIPPENREINELIDAFVRPFDLRKSPLLRVGLVTLSQDHHLLMLDTHHIVSDGKSMQLIVGDFVHLFNGETLEPLHFQYKDYAFWIQGNKENGKLDAHEQYWINEFQEAVPILELLTDFDRPAFQSYRGKRLSFELSKEKSAQIREFSKKQGVTIFITLLSCFKVLLQKYSGNTDLTVGTPISGRPDHELEKIIGMFVNTLIIRSEPTENKVFRDFLNEVSEKSVKAFDHQFFSYEGLLEQIKLERDLSRNPLFDTMFVLQEEAEAELELNGDLEIFSQKQEFTSSKFDLSLMAYQNSGIYRFELEYCTDLFEEKTIQRFARSYEKILDEIIRNPALSIGKIDVLDAGERQLLLKNQFSELGIEPGTTVSKLISENILHFKNNTAIYFDNQLFKYSYLNKYINYYCEQFQGAEGKRIGILLEKSIFSVAAILAALKSGFSFVNLDPNTPENRLEYIIRDSEIKTLVLSKKYRHHFDTQVIYSEDVKPIEAEFPDCSQADGECYVIYTSGSTGNPKGVSIRHDSLATNLLTQNSLHNWDESLTTIYSSSSVFDASMLELFTSLINGGKLVIPDEAKKHDYGYLFELIVQENVTALQGTTSFYKTWLQNISEYDKSVHKLKDFYIGGESLTKELVHELLREFPGVRINNHYGPTETTIDAIIKKDIRTFESNSIGIPMPNVEILLLSESNDLVPYGVKGEICIGGKLLANGYVNLPEQTEKAFIPHPFKNGERIYKTGDLARWNKDNELEFFGRNDQQVKIRGYRIELLEIQSRILEINAIQDALVHVVKSSSGDSELVAYLVADKEPEPKMIREQLKTDLPAYMIPGAFYFLDRIPLTPNGKVDYKALPEIKVEIKGDKYLESYTETENQVLEVWRSILGIQEISTDDNFFEIGGHSLKATQVVSALQKLRNQQIKLKELFVYPTIESFSAYIDREARGNFKRIPVAKKAVDYPLSHPQKRLWVIDQLIENKSVYNISNGFLLEGPIHIPCFERAFQTIVKRHEVLRTSFVSVDGNPRQLIHEYSESNGFKLERIDLSAHPDAYQQAEILVEEQADTHFDLSRETLLKCCLIKLEEEKFVLSVVMHHIIADGWSLEIMMNEFAICYQAYVRDEKPDLPALRIQYKDFTVYQQEQEIEADERYWLEKLSGDIELIALPQDFSKSETLDSKGEQVHVLLETELVEGLKQKAKEKQTTLSNVIFAVFNILLKQLSGQEDLIVGMTIANRNHPDLEPLIGFFVNSLVIRTTVTEDLSFDELLEQVKATTLEAFEHQNYPFDLLVEKLSPQRFANQQPLVNVTYSYQNLNDLKFEKQVIGSENGDGIGKIQLSSFRKGEGNNTSKYDLLLFVNETDQENEGQALQLKFEYDSGLFKRESMNKYLLFFKRFLNLITQQENA